MAVGKSAVGRTLAKKLKRRFVDLDKFIEKSAGMKVREIFGQKGEAYFRELERAALGQVLEQNNQVIATGGGVVMDAENLRLLREKTLLVRLTANTDVLLNRAGNGAKRPLVKGGNRKERIAEILKQREANYAQAHVGIDTSDLTVDQVVEKIITLLNLES